MPATLPSDARQWLVDTALPFWGTIGVDHEQGGFVERLQWDGAPDLAADKRVRVQARQIYVFSHASLLGLMPAGAVVAGQGYDFLMRHACPDGVAKGFVRSLSREGSVRDATRDTYDHAFILFAFSWYYRATRNDDVRAAIMATGDAIWRLLRHPGGHGFVVDTKVGDALHQNPHMHLFEAVLAAHEATGEPVFLDRAHELFALFRDRMFDPELGVLREYYDGDWRPAPGDAGRIVEPGHHCEWVWLLKRYADRIGEPLCPEASRLQDFADRHGRPDGNLLCDELWIDGSVKKAHTRSWPQTEALKARIALAEIDGTMPAPTAEAIAGALFDDFLGKPLPGAWIDWIDADGRPLVDAIPASTLYHVFLGLSEYLRSES
jgi:mannose/cellobiose epimerase-like protein (N-acyl-D-glucosamine 2-epimerase family)